jgi:hypothetical protein
MMLLRGGLSELWALYVAVYAAPRATSAIVASAAAGPGPEDAGGDEGSMLV